MFDAAYGVHAANAGTGSHACRRLPTVRRTFGKTPRVVKMHSALCNGSNVSGDETIYRSILRARQFHTLLRDEGGEQLIEELHDGGIAPRVRTGRGALSP